MSDNMFNMCDGDPKQILFVNERQFDWSDSETHCMSLKTGLTGLILKYIFRNNYSPLIISWDSSEIYV